MLGLPPTDRRDAAVGGLGAGHLRRGGWGRVEVGRIAIGHVLPDGEIEPVSPVRTLPPENFALEAHVPRRAEPFVFDDAGGAARFRPFHSSSVAACGTWPIPAWVPYQPGCRQWWPFGGCFGAGRSVCCAPVTPPRLRPAPGSRPPVTSILPCVPKAESRPLQTHPSSLVPRGTIR